MADREHFLGRCSKERRRKGGRQGKGGKPLPDATPNMAVNRGGGLKHNSCVSNGKFNSKWRRKYLSVQQAHKDTIYWLYEIIKYYAQFVGKHLQFFLGNALIYTIKQCTKTMYLAKRF